MEEEKAFPHRHLLTFVLRQPDIYHPITVYGWFCLIYKLRPNYMESLAECPNDYFPIEIQYLKTGWFFWVKKLAWQSGHVNQADIINFNKIIKCHHLIII